MAAELTCSLHDRRADARIHEIQGAAHLSPLDGSGRPPCRASSRRCAPTASTCRTRLRTRRPATSEGIFVFTARRRRWPPGDGGHGQPAGSPSSARAARATDQPDDHRARRRRPSPGWPRRGDRADRRRRRRARAAARRDRGRRAGDVETSGIFDPAQDGIDFYESLEGMLRPGQRRRRRRPDERLRRDLRARRQRRERRRPHPAAASSSAATDFNPERIFLDDVLAPTRRTSTSATASRRRGRRAGLQLRQLQAPADGAPRAVDRRPRARDDRGARSRASCASRRSTSRTSTRPTRRRSSRGWPSIIVDNLRSPDLIAIEEVQDNNGATNDGDDRRDAHLRSADRRDRRRPAGRRTSSGRSTRWTTRTAASRAATSASASSSAPTAGCAFVDRPGGDADDRRRTSSAQRPART